MKNAKGLAFICLTIALTNSCGKPSLEPAAQAKRYQLKGKVISIDQQSKMVNIDSEAIPGFMGAMTMPYTVKPEGELGKLKPGEAITADVVVQDENAWLENITVAQETGTVKWFDDAKGYGLIHRQSGEEVFVNSSDIRSSGSKKLTEGEQVRFDVNKGPKGWQAVNVTTVDSETTSGK